MDKEKLVKILRENELEVSDSVITHYDRVLNEEDERTVVKRWSIDGYYRDENGGVVDVFIQVEELKDRE